MSTPEPLPQSSSQVSSPQQPPVAVEVREPKNFVDKVHFQKQLIDFLRLAYGGLLIVTMLLFFLEGFSLWGFHLDVAIMKWLGGATIGEIAGLFMLALKEVFKKDTR